LHTNASLARIAGGKISEGSWRFSHAEIQSPHFLTSENASPLRLCM
jgi:hypothetical protein